MAGSARSKASARRPTSPRTIAGPLAGRLRRLCRKVLRRRRIRASAGVSGRRGSRHGLARPAARCRHPARTTTAPARRPRRRRSGHRPRSARAAAARTADAPLRSSVAWADGSRRWPPSRRRLARRPRCRRSAAGRDRRRRQGVRDVAARGSVVQDQSNREPHRSRARRRVDHVGQLVRPRTQFRILLQPGLDRVRESGWDARTERQQCRPCRRRWGRTGQCRPADGGEAEDVTRRADGFRSS